jgi:glycine cleavage system aminomethyltransferase T
MVEIRRESPVKFAARPLEIEVRDHWTVALVYDGEGEGPWLVDLSHKTRWDLQNRDIDAMTVGDLAVPEAAGDCTLAGHTLINRMNATQAAIHHLGARAPYMPDASGFTDVTEATLLVALFGPMAFRVAEKLTNLDFMDPAKEAPFLLQGPFGHVPCQIVALEKTPDGSGGFLLSCSRGYGDSMVGAILQAGAEFGLRPAGENRFDIWIQGLQR